MIDNNTWNYKYQEALTVLQNKFHKLYIEYSKKSENNPIEHIKYRIKTPYSIKDKIIKRIEKKSNIVVNPNDIVLNQQIIDKYVNDVVGMRIVCSFKSDLQKIIKLIREDKELILIDEKNYIDNPKTNGYKSYHMRVYVPIELNGQKEYIKAEIQLRTLAMDMCASLEHIIYYKKNIKLPEKTMNDLERTVKICDEFDNILDNYIIDIRGLNLDKEPIDLDIIPEKDFNNLIPKYEEALKIIEEKIISKKEENKLNNNINKIEHINSRIKNKERIIRKLKKQGLEINLKNIEEHLSDIAAIRVVCPFKKDVYEIINKIKEIDEIEIIKEKDYISNPKESGYRSYHLIALVPIYTEGLGKIYVKTEIQVRSMAMDMWASLERKLCYQKDDYPEIKEELKRNAEIISYIDDTMDKIGEESKKLINNQNNIITSSQEKTKKLIKEKKITYT